MIDISLLDQSKTYVGYEVGTSKVAKKIQAYSKKEIEKLFNQNKPKEHEVASHVFSIVWNNEENKWFVYESHFLLDGVRKYDYDTWVRMQKKDSAKQYFVFPFELSVDILNFYEKYNLGYGAGSIVDLPLGEIAMLGGLSWPDYPGVISSELIALCDVDYKVCNRYGCTPNKMEPVHFQAYAYEKFGKENLISGSN